MGEPVPRPRLPWGLLLTLALLAVVVALVYRTEPAVTVAAAVGTAAAVFLAMRWWQNYLWGVASALLVTLNPFYQEWARRNNTAPVVEGLGLVVLACTTAAWRLTFRPTFAGIAWILPVLLLCLSIGLTWPIQPPAGLSAALVAGPGLLLAALLAARRHRQSKTALPSWGNVAIAALAGLTTPVLGLLLAPAARLLPWSPEFAVSSTGEALDLFWTTIHSTTINWQPRAFAGEHLLRWGWPTPWVLLPLMTWGLWRSLRRGWRQSARHQPPLAWTLTLFTLVALAGVLLCSPAGPNNEFLRLAILGLMLSVFCVADLIRGLADRLMLAPPTERE
jgi:hypothetical protein